MIDRNQIDVAKHAFQYASQFFGMFGAIVYPADQGIFESDSPTRFGDVVSKGFHDIVKRKAPVNRHELGS
ncbi:hypothetical protein D3C76_1827590 [compost metagenome]